MNYLTHLIGTLITTTLLYYILQHLGISMNIIITFTFFLTGIISGLIPDIDTGSRIRKITDLSSIIIIVTTLALKIYPITIMTLIIGIILPRITKHRGIYHSWATNTIITLLLLYYTNWTVGLAYITGFTTHKILDKI